MFARFIALLAACLVLVPGASRAQTSAAQTFDSNGVPIAYTDRGRGAPVVLLHGYTGTYARHWEAPGVMQALESAGYRVVAMDCRGHGQSGKPADPGQYGLAMVDDVVRLLDHLKIERAHVVGYSMGGAIASQLLVRQPKRLLTVTLLGSGWDEDLTGLKTWSAALADGMARKDASGLLRAVGSTAATESGPTEAEMATMNAALFARNDPQAMAAVARTLPVLMDVARSALQASTVPLLAIIGEHDAALPAVKRMKTVVPAMEIVELPGANHVTSVRPSAVPLVAFQDKHRRE